MDRDRTPQSGQVYRGPSGEPMLYVRTEARGQGEPEHLFVLTRDRVVYTIWSEELPEDFELVADPGAAERADRLAEARDEVARERDALLSAMKAAVPLVPVVTANHLRKVYREALA